MQDSLLITYTDGDSDGFDLGLLGVSFTGMSALMKQIIETMGIDGSVEFKTASITHGSVELHNAFVVTLNSMPFKTPNELYDFLRLASPEMLHEAQQFISGALGVHEDINSYFARNPFDQNVVTGLIVGYVLSVFKWTPKQKNELTTRDDELGEITLRQARKMQSMVNGGRYRRALKPLTDGDVRSIRIAAAEVDNLPSVVLTESSLENYLPEDARILPEFANGTTYSLTGKVVSLESTHGEVVKIKLDNIDRTYSLVTAHPQDGQSTVDFTVFYKKQVQISAEVVRRSMFKRPEFVILSIEELNQQSQLLVD